MAEEEFSASCTGVIVPDGTLLGDYRVDGFFAFSSVGAVYSGTDLARKRSCSIHVISSAIAGHSPDVAARLLARAQEACFFRHKNFVSINKCFTLSDMRCIVTERISGLPLRDFVECRKVLPVSPEQISAQLASLLAAAGKSGKILFDFNPDDIYITPNGQVRVIYPGGNNQLHLLSGATLCLESGLLRNAPFSAPELLLGNSKNSFPASVYSLGVVWAYMVQKKLPFPEGNLHSILARAVSGGIQLPDEPHQRSILLHLTAKDPADRPGSGRNLLGLFGRKKKIFPVIAAAAVVLICLAAGVGMTGYFRKLFGSSGDEMVAELQKYETEPRPKKPAPSLPVPAAEKTLISSAESNGSAERVPLHTAAKKIAASQVRVPVQHTQMLIDHCRKRLEQLEKDLAERKVDTRLLKLHKERIEFRKRQYIALSRRRNIEELRQEMRRKNSSSAANRDLRSVVEAYFSRCKTPGDFAKSQALVAAGKAQPFPVEKLKERDVDFSMFFEFNVAHKFLSRSAGRGKRGTNLALLMLSGAFMKQEEALQILCDAEAPLEGITIPLFLQCIRRPGISEAQFRYLIRTAMQEKYFLPVEAVIGWRHSKRGWTAVFLEEMLLQGALLSGRNGISALHRAAALNRREFLPLLFRADAPLEYCDKEGRTPLFYAFLNGNEACAAQLIAAGADTEIRDKYGKNALAYKETGELVAAIRAKDIAKARRAVSQGADVNSFLYNGDTLLIAACRRGDLKMVELLVNKGATIDKRSRMGETPLGSVFLSAHFPHPVIFEYLLKQNADASENPYLRKKNRSFMDLLCFEEKAAKHRYAPRFAKIMLKSGKFKTEPGQIFKVCRDRNTLLFRELVRYWPDMGKKEYSGLYLETLKAGMPADVIKILLERKVPFPDEKELKESLRHFGTPEIHRLFPEQGRTSRSVRTMRRRAGSR